MLRAKTVVNEGTSMQHKPQYCCQLCYVATKNQSSHRQHMASKRHKQNMIKNDIFNYDTSDEETDTKKHSIKPKKDSTMHINDDGTTCKTINIGKVKLLKISDKYIHKHTSANSLTDTTTIKNTLIKNNVHIINSTFSDAVPRTKDMYKLFDTLNLTDKELGAVICAYNKKHIFALKQIYHYAIMLMMISKNVNVKILNTEKLDFTHTNKQVKVKKIKKVKKNIN
jgi:hypothetical protein